MEEQYIGKNLMEEAEKLLAKDLEDYKIDRIAKLLKRKNELERFLKQIEEEISKVKSLDYIPNGECER